MNEEVLALSLAKVDEYEYMIARYDSDEPVFNPEFPFYLPILSFKDEGWTDWTGKEIEEIHVDCNCSECSEYTELHFVSETFTEEEWMKYGEAYL